jgi:hypothetical protein
MATQTTQQLVEYYANLLIYQYVTQLKAYATVFDDVQPILMPQGFISPLTDNEGNWLFDNEGDPLYSTVTTEPTLPLALQDAFNFGSAVGVQLDTLATYIGGLRTNLQLDGTYLALTDLQFTLYLQALAARNNMGSDMGSIEAFLGQYFPGVFAVYDFEDMHMSFIYYPVASANPAAEAFITAGHLPVPMTVGATLVFNPNNDLFFAFSTYNDAAQPGTSGYNFYGSSQVGEFLTYTDSITVIAG